MQNRSDLKNKLKSLYNYISKELKFNSKPNNVILTQDIDNSSKGALASTGGYDPKSKNIYLYVTNRHDSDIARSFAHELIHFWQDIIGKDITGYEQNNYAQNNDKLRKIEEEAYLKGNMLFRDWRDKNKI